MKHDPQQFKHPGNLCLNLSLRQADRVITQIYNNRLRKYGLTGSQFSILRAVHLSREATSLEVKDLLILDQTTLSRNLKRLVDDRLILVSTDRNDRRRKILKLSAKGKAVYRKAEKAWEAAQVYLKDRLGTELSTELLEISQKVTAVLKLEENPG